MQIWLQSLKTQVNKLLMRAPKTKKKKHGETNQTERAFDLSMHIIR
jgi:hypothetical protein